MRILIVHARHRELGGEDVVAHGEAALLNANGHTVHVHDARNPNGASALAAFAAAPWNLRQCRRFESALREFKPDVVHIHNTWFALSQAVIRAAAQSPAATVMTLHNYRLLCADSTLLRDNKICRDCVDGSPWPAIRHRCYRGSLPQSVVAASTISLGRITNLYDGVDRFIAPTDLVRDIHIDSGRIDSRHIATISHFLTDPGPRPHPPSQSTSMIWAGRLAPGKGVESLLKAWRTASLQDCDLHIVGDGPLRATLESSAPANVHFLGFRPLEETRALIRDARAFLFVSEWLEPFGLVLLEALAPGTPILGFDTGDTRKIVGDSGRLVATGDFDALASQLKTIGNDELDAIGAASRAHFLRNYTPDIHVRSLESAYEDAVAAKRTRCS